MVFILVAGALEASCAPSWAAVSKPYSRTFFEEDDYFELQSSLRRQGAAEELVASKNFAADEAAFFSVENTLQVPQSTVSTDADSISRWLSQNQTASTSGLIVSHPDDPGFIYHDGIQEDWAKIRASTQGFTYDQAIAGIALLKQGDISGAKKIFDFFSSEAEIEGHDFSGFWTVYNVDPVFSWKKYEWRKGMGENAWVALFSLQYHRANQGTTEGDRGLELASKVARWIGTLPDNQLGAVAMSPANPSAFPDFGSLYSVENNFDYYALLKVLKDKAPDQNDRQLFTARFNALKVWLKNEAYDNTQGLFKRGGQYIPATGNFVWDTAKSLDVNSWAISALGISTLADEFGVDVEGFVARIQETFAVQEDNSFGGDIMTAKGFDFSDAANAGAVGRTGMKWVEGTNHMVLDYQLLAGYYRAQDPVKADRYLELADYFQGRNADNAIVAGDTLSYVVSDLADVQVFESTSNWKTAPGQAAASTVWAYFSLGTINPFEVFPENTAPPSISAFSSSVATVPLGMQDLRIDVDRDAKATILFENKVYQAIFDEQTQTIQMADVQRSPNSPLESWVFGFESGPSLGSFALSFFNRRLVGADGWLYEYGYDFSLDGLLDSERFGESFVGHHTSQMTLYDYVSVYGQMRLGSMEAILLSDGKYSLGQETDYEYIVDAEGALTTTITVSQEMHNVPLLRTIVSYRLTIRPDGGTHFESLGTQNTPM